MPQIFEVGGCVRDELLGLQSKDIDFTFVLDNLDRTVEEGFQIMENWLTHKGFTIFLSTPECFTIRAKFPEGHMHEGLVADFVLARKEVGYEEGTRRPLLELGTLADDLIRRDFTLNALAKDENGVIIDLFGGAEDLKHRLLRTPLNPQVTMMDDPLRVLRAIRFAITKDLIIPDELAEAMQLPEVTDKLFTVVSIQRIREELFKCFKHDTKLTIKMLQEFNLFDLAFGGELWLKPTFEKK